MATAIATAERASGDQAHFIAFCADSTTHAAVDRAIGDLMLPHASIRKGTIKDAIKYLSQHPSPKLLMTRPLKTATSSCNVSSTSVTSRKADWSPFSSYRRVLSQMSAKRIVAGS